MLDRREIVTAARGYIRRHPEEVLRTAKNAVFLKFGIPLDALRFVAGRIPGRKAPKDVQIEAVPPGLRLGATVDLMGTAARASMVLYIDGVRINPGELRFELRFADVEVEILGDGDSPVAGLLKSGALDLSKPGNLVKFMPNRPEFLIEAEDDRVVIDLHRHPMIGGNPAAARVLGLVTPVVTLGSIQTDWEHLDFALNLFQDGLGVALASLREHL